MTNQDAMSEIFHFDERLSFSENCDAFLSALERIDAEMASILRDNWDTLIKVVQEGERDSKARGEFNSAVAQALDALILPVQSEGGE